MTRTQSVDAGSAGGETVAPEFASHWEAWAERRWGKYLIEVERQAVHVALGQFDQPGRALEVGCDGGRWSKVLAEDGWQPTCTEIEPNRLAICQRRIPQAKCILVDAQSKTFPVQDESIDLLVAIQVPLVDEFWFLEDAARVVVPGGVVVGTMDNMWSWRAPVANLRARRRRDGPPYRTPYPRWRLHARRLGFRLIHETGYCWPPFSRSSDSPLVPACVKSEEWLQLRRLVSLSPWVSFVLKKAG